MTNISTIDILFKQINIIGQKVLDLVIKFLKLFLPKYNFPFKGLSSKNKVNNENKKTKIPFKVVLIFFKEIILLNKWRFN